MKEKSSSKTVNWPIALRQKLLAFWHFSRPHTIYGTSASLLGLYLLALGSWPLLPLHWPDLAIAALACLSANIYIVGLNQLVDVEIDRINKPNLPLASGALSWRDGFWMTLVSGIAGLAIATMQPYLWWTVLASSAIGTAYSLPPIRLKRFPVLAAFCIYTVRGLVVNVGLYAYFRAASDRPVQLTGEFIALVAFVLVFTFVIAIFKDIPDMEGDRQFDIATFSLKLGPQRVFNLSLALLCLAYTAMAISGVLWLAQVNRLLLVVGHCSALAILLWARWRLPSWSRTDIYSFYQLIWKLFYAEYLLFPLATLWV
jgi:homogentisate phytyltransferase/homogentisate geranylgeranyltransferase